MFALAQCLNNISGDKASAAGKREALAIALANKKRESGS
jgi:hypothetical protein